MLLNENVTRKVTPVRNGLKPNFLKKRIVHSIASLRTAVKISAMDPRTPFEDCSNMNIFVQ